MSYILDALKKSDQERRRGTPPNLQTLHAPDSSPSKGTRLRLWLLFAVVIVNTALLAWWLRPWQAGDAVAPLQTAAIESPSPVSAPSSAAEMDRAPESSVSTAEKNAAPSHRVSPVDADPPGSAREAPASRLHIPARGASSPQPDPSKLEAVKKPSEKQAEIPSPPAKGKTAEKDGRSELVQRTKDLELALTAPLQKKPEDREGDSLRSATDVQPLPVQKIPGIHDLPVALQREIPDMAFTMLVYSNKPEERILNINGRMMREGQEVAPGLRLEEINQDGAVFSFRGTRFRKGMF